MGLYDIANKSVEESDNRQINMTNTTIAGLPAVEKMYYQYEFGATATRKY
jgi:hypothetical protein